MLPSVLASNLVCPVGLLASSACAAMRARSKVFEDSPFLGPDRSPVICSAIDRIPQAHGVAPRLRWLLAHTLGPLLEQAQLGEGRLALFFAFVERPRRGADEALARALFDEALAGLGPRCASAPSQLYFGGAPAGFRALEDAWRALESGAAETCVVMGLDSWLDARSLLWLSERAPLDTGIVPGEAGAALVLSAPEAVPAEQRLARVLGLGFGVEPSARDPQVPLRGDGLREAVAGALGECVLHETHLRMSDDAGTHAGAKEQMLLLARLLKVPIEQLPLWLPAQFIGHVGAAAGLAQIVWAIQARLRSYLPGPRVLCTASNFSGERGAALVEVLAQPQTRVWGTLEGQWS